MEVLRFEMLRMRALLSAAALACVTSLAGAQQSAASSSFDQQVDCSDPAVAATSACSSQQTGRSGLNLPLQTSPNPQVSPFYTDSETLNRQNTLRPIQQQTPPEPLTEFQKFAASATGEILPIFGADLFRQVPSTFAPLDLSPVPTNYIVGPGDELRIRVWGQLTFQANVRVDRSGEVYLPHVGPVHVAGLAFSELSSQLQNAIGTQYRNFQLTVDLGQIRAIQIYTSGQARHPGVYTVSGLSSLLDALFSSGGPSVKGSLRRIELQRDGKVVSQFDLYGLLTTGDKSKDAKLESGDVIFIPPVGPQVAITGSVRNPGIFELKPGESLKDLLGDAGGASGVAAASTVSIGRVVNHRDLRNLNVSFDESGLATPLADGDLVHVSSIVPRFRETVTLRGNVANPGKFGWHAGMRISELIPDKESLLTRSYWWKRAQLGLPTPDFEPARGFARLRQPIEPTTLSSALGAVGAYRGQQPGAPVEPGTEFTQQQQYGFQQEDSGESANLSNQRGESASPTGQNSSLAQQQSGTNQGSGTQSPDGVPLRPKTDLRFLAPEIDWDYAAIERLDPNTLKTEVIPFDLGRLVLQHDNAQDLELQPGDVVTIFSEADIRLPIAQQSKMVKLEGEFVHAGSYTAQPGETLKQLVERAGGLTNHAYLYGSEFRRESTRQIQQTRIDEYVRNLEAQIERGTLATATSGASSPQDIANSAAAHGSEQEIIAQLRTIRATGRMVLEFKPDSAGAGEIPDVALENGDTFIVPSRPANVNVIGAVYDQNSFLYNPARNVNAYLHLAGGPNRSADARHEFIIRADGEVLSKESTSSMWSNSFYSMRLNPGDTIIVPEKTFKPSALRGVLDWSQVFSQFALGAASISLLR